MALILSDRRLMNLAEAATPAQTRKSVTEFNDAFSESLENYNELAINDQENMKKQFEVHVMRAELIVFSIEGEQEYPEIGRT